MPVFICAGMARKDNEPKIGTTFRVFQAYLYAAKVEEAIGTAYVRAEKDFPREEGWRDHAVIAEALPTEWLSGIVEYEKNINQQRGGTTPSK